jgi:predicted nucleotidyltransferase
MTPADAHSLTAAIANWVRTNSDLRALALAGSWSRGTARPDSDLDLLILAVNPNQYQSDQGWLHQIILPEPFRILSGESATYGVVWAYHVALEPATELELGFGPLDWASTDPIDAGSRRVVTEGFKVIVDKDGQLERLVGAIR